jgi:hypothetical protein
LVISLFSLDCVSSRADAAARGYGGCLANPDRKRAIPRPKAGRLLRFFDF